MVRPGSSAGRSWWVRGMPRVGGVGEMTVGEMVVGENGEEFRVEVTIGEHAIDVRVTGEIDIATVEELRAILWGQPEEPRMVRLELSGVDVLSAAGVRMLVAVHLRRRGRGGQLMLCNPNATVRRALRAMRVNRVIPIVGTGGATGGPPPRRPWTNAGPLPRRSKAAAGDPPRPVRGHPVNGGPAGLVSRGILVKDGWSDRSPRSM
jgi:anti-sigma B factor antagonist